MQNTAWITGRSRLRKQSPSPVTKGVGNRNLLIALTSFCRRPKPNWRNSKMRKLLSRSILIFSLVGLAGCAHTGVNYDGYTHQSYSDARYRNSVTGYSKYGQGGFTRSRPGVTRYDRRGVNRSSRYNRLGLRHSRSRHNRNYGHLGFGRGVFHGSIGFRIK